MIPYLHVFLYTGRFKRSCALVRTEISHCVLMVATWDYCFKDGSTQDHTFTWHTNHLFYLRPVCAQRILKHFPPKTILLTVEQRILKHPVYPPLCSVHPFLYLNLVLLLPCFLCFSFFYFLSLPSLLSGYLELWRLIFRKPSSIFGYFLRYRYKMASVLFVSVWASRNREYHLAAITSEELVSLSTVIDCHRYSSRKNRY